MDRKRKKPISPPVDSKYSTYSTEELISNGLSQDDVDYRVATDQVNKISKKYKKTYIEIILKNIFTFFNILLIGIAVLLLMTGASPGELGFLLVVFCNLAIGTFQEIRAKIITDKLNLISSEKITVIRNGIELQIMPSAIVKDDILKLDAGKQIPVDAELLDGYIEVDESLLTGESIAMKKSKKTNSINLLAGTNIISGVCYARAIKVGNNTYAANLQRAAKKLEPPKSDIMKALNRIIKTITIIAIPLAILSSISGWIAVKDLPKVVSGVSASVVGMIPAGMVLLTSVALAVGVIRLSTKKVLVQQMFSIEMLARTDVMCLDKTGTLTDGTMVVENIESLVPEYTNDDIKALMGSYLRVNQDKNSTAMALRGHFPLNEKFVAIEDLPFSSSRKYSSVTFKDFGECRLGAPEILLQPFQDDAQIQEVLHSCSEKATLGLRTLVLIKDTTPIAIFTIRDNVRKDVKQTLKWFSDNDVDIKIISGDNPLTVAHIAKIAGVKETHKAISLAGLTDDEVRKAVFKHTVFGRVSPEQKALIVDTLKHHGKVVAMIGDGTNDILSMKKSDCSIAMGNGSDAAKRAADMVLLDNKFSVMNSVVAEGRRVTNNIQRSSTLFLMKCAFTIILTLITTIVGFIGVKDFIYPFNTTAILIFEWFVIGIPSFFLALQTNNQKIQGSFAKMLSSKAIPAAITLIISVLSIMVLQYIPIFNINAENIRTMCVFCFTFGGFVIFNQICKPFDLYRGLLFCICFCLACCCFITINFLPLPLLEFMGLDQINMSILELNHWLLITVVCLFCAASYNTIQSICQRLFKMKDSILNGTAIKNTKLRKR